MRLVLAVTVLAMLACVSAFADEPVKVSSEYPTLSTGVLSSSVLTTLPKGVVLQSGDLKFTQKDLEEEIRTFPKEQWPELKRNLFYVLEKKTSDSILAWEARTWAKTAKNPPQDPESLNQAYFRSLTSGVTATDEELKSFYDQNTDIMGGAAFEDAKNEIRDFVLNQKRDKVLLAHIRGLGGKYDFQVDRAWVAKQNSAAVDNPVDKARTSGMPLLVDFGAEWCKPCKMLAPIVKSIKEEYAGRLNVVVINTADEPVLATRYGADFIPLLVFFDKDGTEFFRNNGFWSKEQITAKLAEMGVK